MPVQAFNLWRQRGHFYLWRYLGSGSRRSNWACGSDWHCSVDREGSESLIALIDLLLASEWPLHRKVMVTIPEEIMVGGGTAWRSATALILRHPSNEMPDAYWDLAAERDVVTLTAGRNKMIELREAIRGVPDFKDDFRVYPESGKPTESNSAGLWFWTHLTWRR